MTTTDDESAVIGRLSTLDRFLRLDHEPWQVLHPRLGPPLVIRYPVRRFVGANTCR